MKKHRVLVFKGQGRLSGARQARGRGGERAREKHQASFFFLPPTAESFGVSAQIGSGVVRGRFHEGSTRVSPGFHEVLRGLQGGASTKKITACCWGYRLSFFFFAFSEGLTGNGPLKTYFSLRPRECVSYCSDHGPIAF